MERITRAPGKYVQGIGILKKIAEYCRPYGRHPLLLFGNGLKAVQQTVKDSFFEWDYQIAEFHGECEKEEINRILTAGKGCDFVIGIGGGKVLDTAKAVGEFGKLPVVVIPTAASTDAPCSALSVLYTPEGVFSEYLQLTRNPELVFVDSEVIAAAPVRLLVSGMGDALSTYFEARAVYHSGAQTQAGGQTSEAALILAEHCYKTLLAYGQKAKHDVEHGLCTEAVERIIEANIYFSGIGFESGGLAAAHAVNNGLSILEGTVGTSHGERVAFGTLVQLVLENVSEQEFREVQQFARSVGLPVSFSELGITEISQEELLAAARAACEMNGSIYHMPIEITKEMVAEAMKRVDERAGQRQTGESNIRE